MNFLKCKVNHTSLRVFLTTEGTCKVHCVLCSESSKSALVRDPSLYHTFRVYKNHYSDPVQILNYNQIIENIVVVHFLQPALNYWSISLAGFMTLVCSLVVPVLLRLRHRPVGILVQPSF